MANRPARSRARMPPQVPEIFLVPPLPLSVTPGLPPRVNCLTSPSNASAGVEYGFDRSSLCTPELLVTLSDCSDILVKPFENFLTPLLHMSAVGDTRTSDTIAEQECHWSIGVTEPFMEQAPSIPTRDRRAVKHPARCPCTPLPRNAMSSEPDGYFRQDDDCG